VTVPFQLIEILSKPFLDCAKQSFKPGFTLIHPASHLFIHQSALPLTYLHHFCGQLKIFNGQVFPTFAMSLKLVLTSLVLLRLTNFTELTADV
jgi:hypothetical protein